MTTTKTQDAPRGKAAAEARRKKLAPRVAELLAQGNSHNAISKELKISHPTVKRIADELGGVATEPSAAYHEKHAQIVELYHAGLSGREVARQLKVSTKTVVLSLRREGSVRHPGHRPDPESLARAKAFLEDRAGYAEASRSTGIAVETLKLHFPGMGLTRSEVGLLGWPLRRIANRAAANGIDLVPLSRVRGA